MKRLLSVSLLVGIFFSSQWASAQLNNFGNRAVQTRSLDGANLADPQINPSDIQTDPTGYRNIYLIYRFYSCAPWRHIVGQTGGDTPSGNHVRSVQSDYAGFTMEIDTANNDPTGQLQTDLNHPAYGLYCLRVIICIPYYQFTQSLWQPGILHQFFVRLSYYCPPVCWYEGWWYYRSINTQPIPPFQPDPLYGIAHTPSWAPWHYWGRGGPVWCLTVTHPYGYTWGSPFYQHPGLDFCVYGLRSAFFPIGNPRQHQPVCGNRNLKMQFVPPVPGVQWVNYPCPFGNCYWPYRPYCSRWYWWQFPFSVSRWLPPVAQYGVAVVPQGNPATFLPQPPGPFRVDPFTCAICTTRPIVLPQGDTDGNGVVGVPDQDNFKRETLNANQDLNDSDDDPQP